MEEKKKIKPVVSIDMDTWKTITKSKVIVKSWYTKWNAVIEGKDEEYVFKRRFLRGNELEELLGQNPKDCLIELGYSTTKRGVNAYQYIWKKDDKFYLIDRATAKKLVEDGVI